MSKNNLGLLALHYLNKLPREALEKCGSALAIAAYICSASRLAELEVFSTKANWGRFDFLQHAYLSLALRNEGKSAEAGSEWTFAQKEASSQPQSLTLSQVIADWVGKEKEDRIALDVSQAAPNTAEGLASAISGYANAGDTHLDLYRIPSG